VQPPWSEAPSGAVGTFVSSLVDIATPSGQVDNVTDIDSGAQLGFAVTAVDPSLACYYSLNDGSTWTGFIAVSAASARLIAADNDMATPGTGTSAFNAGTGVWTASGAIANVNTLLAGLTFTPAKDFNGNFTITTNIGDGGAVVVTGSKAITGTAANDTPVLVPRGASYYLT
jgi:hypothetical protein